jgi:hypothetical protein
LTAIEDLNSSPFTSKALSNKSDAVLEEWLQLFTQGFLRSSQIRVCKDPPVTAGEAVEALQTELARRRERRARDEELSADASASRHSKANQERTNAGKGSEYSFNSYNSKKILTASLPEDIPTHPYFLSALKRKSDEELEEWIQIFSLPTTNILCNPPMTTTEALEAIRTELARRRESFAGPGMWGREEAPAYLEVSQNRRASEEGMDTEQDSECSIYLLTQERSD